MRINIRKFKYSLDGKALSCLLLLPSCILSFKGIPCQKYDCYGKCSLEQGSNADSQYMHQSKEPVNKPEIQKNAVSAAFLKY